MNQKLKNFSRTYGVSFQEKLNPSGQTTIRTTSKKIIRDKKIFVNYNEENREEQIDQRLEKLEASVERKKVLKKEKKVKEKRMLEKGIEPDITVSQIDEVFSKYIRLRDGPKCYTCGGRNRITCGHFVTRMCRETRRHPDNCRSQCWFKCNSKESGNGKPVEFEANLRRDGIDVDKLIAYELLWTQGKSNKPNSVELREIYDFWKNNFNLLQANV